MVNGNSVPTGLQKFGTVIGESCRLGIHTSINPGVKIGRCSFIKGGGVVEKDVPDKSFLSMKDGEIRIQKNKQVPPCAKKVIHIGCG